MTTMRQVIKASTLAASAILLMCSAVGQATPVKGTFSVDANTEDPGLKIDITNTASPFQFDLNVGETVSGTAFTISTPEGWVNSDDWALKQINVNFSFSLPDALSGSISGTTQGWSFYGLVQGGDLNWTDGGSKDLYYGPNSDGHLRVWLEDTTFGKGLFGLDGWGAKVYGGIKLISDATGPVVDDPTVVPEPQGILLFGLGLLGLLTACRVRQRRA